MLNKSNSLKYLIIAKFIFLLVSVANSQNTWTTATVKNDFGIPIYNVRLQHRYDNDHYDRETWPVLNNGEQGKSFKIGYWTGFGRTGKDYWHITFEADGQLWYCKDNFYCFLRSSDSKGTVVCRIYRENGKPKMYVDCPHSSDCKVALENGLSNPNSWATVVVKKEWGKEIKNIKVNHRYDNDHFDTRIYSNLLSNETSSPFKIGFWTGFGRTGKDYWKIEFEVDGKKWTCKDNFHCFLTKNDVNGNVILKLSKDRSGGKMVVDLPISSDCQVGLNSKTILNPNKGRPFYLIGHRCNDAEDIGLALSGGCNAIECDLQMDPSTNEIFVNHDNASGIQLSGWLNNAKQLAEIHQDNFALIIFDCKFVTKYSHDVSKIILKNIRDQVRNILSNTSNPINIIFSISRYEDREVFRDIVVDILPNEGIAIDEYDYPEQVETYFQSINATNNWYGNGITTMWEDPKIYPSFKAAGGLRDKNNVYKKTYVWTLASVKTMKQFVEDVEVDGIMINVPGTIFGIAPTGLKEAINVISQSTKVRMAKRSDDPFSVYYVKNTECDTCHRGKINLPSDTTFHYSVSDTTISIETKIYAAVCKKSDNGEIQNSKFPEIFWKSEHQSKRIPLVIKNTIIRKGEFVDTVICKDVILNMPVSSELIIPDLKSDYSYEPSRPLIIKLCVTKRQYRKIRRNNVGQEN